MLTLTEKIRLDDILAWEVDYQFTREIATFRNTTGGTIVPLRGLILEASTTKWGPLATAANAKTMLLNDLASIATMTDNAAALILLNGPARIYPPLTGVASAGWNNIAPSAASYTSLAANLIKVVTEPATAYTTLIAS